MQNRTWLASRAWRPCFALSVRLHLACSASSTSRRARSCPERWRSAALR